MTRILLVDDNPNMRAVIKRMLEKAEHKVIEAENGEEALSMLQKDRPDLILLDIMMPGDDGWTVCRKIKANEKLKSIPVAMLTVRASEEDMNKSSMSGADAHINKPFDMEYLLRTVDTLLKRAQMK